MKPPSAKSAWSPSRTRPPSSRLGCGFPSRIPSDLFFRVRAAAAGDALAAADAAFPLGRNGAVRSGGARPLSRWRMGPAFDSSQRSPARRNAASRRGLENIRILDPVFAPHDAGDRDGGGVSPFLLAIRLSRKSPDAPAISAVVFL